MTTATTATPNIRFRDPALEPVWEKVQDGERISFEDGLSCLQTSDLAALGQMADYAKRRLWGERVYFVFNRQINPTNICVLSCTFCDFAKKKGDAGAYEMEMDEILGKLHPDMHEVHIVGGHHPDWPFERYEGIVRGIHQAYPSIHIKAWTRRRDRLLLQAVQDERGRGARPHEGRRAGVHARRRCGGLLA